MHGSHDYKSFILPLFVSLLRNADAQTCSALDGYPRVDNQPLRPNDLPAVQLFNDWQNSTVSILGNDALLLNVSSGSIRQAGYSNYTSQVELLSKIVTAEEVSRMLQLLNSPQTSLDQDPDTVDGFSTQEFFLDNDSLRNGESGKPGFESPEQAEHRRELRQALQNIAQPILEERITPYVNQRFPTCQGRCTPCYSLIRRYLYGERQSHAPHRDGHSFVTVVVSLSDYGTDYLGGLYVASETSHPYYLRLQQGDAAVHQSDLLHGVKVYPVETENGLHATRWSWILWFRDSEQCEDESHVWFKDCAEKGNPTCQMMHATKVSSIPGISSEEAMKEVVFWNQKAAEMGHATACVKLARALLGKLPSHLKKDRKEARKLFLRAIESSNDPDAQYGMATLYLEDASTNVILGRPNDDLVKKAVAHLEASALGGHPFAMFNLGMVHMMGYGTKIDHALAGEWFEASGLPEGLAARSMHYSSMGEPEKAAEFQRRAQSLGFGAPWRVLARESTGYGGAGGIDFNLPWPPNESNRVPPKW
ncbi:hypothetical protein FisN_16Lh164 [Fistulifera solaris]|uniref:Fe2OG dioxygenase domain-containing protein n=1 Tax=Fistulifera solaris TaxID=1519565 RepID=A0A1Z5KJM2_FISSO|nr:hypothetical protein FisN_16Lh164 [Fistulifera solaris]|eukprot:GAX26325.1 hypothetical protein FisN_16Lh164 [Fistulifera solaris]